MAQNEKTGSDLDIFEGLGKKAPTVPPPNGARSVPPPPPPAAGKALPMDGKRTLLGVTAPGPMPNLAARTPPPPPPGRGSLPPVVAPPAARTSSIPPPPPASVTKPANANASPAVDMDWDEEDEATHIFDETSESTHIFDEEANQATKIGDPIPALAAAPPPHASSVPKAKVTLLGLTAPPATTPTSTFPPPADRCRGRPRRRLRRAPRWASDGSRRASRAPLPASRRPRQSILSRLPWRRRRASATRPTRERCRPRVRRRTSRCPSFRFPAPRRCRISCRVSAAQWKRPPWCDPRRTARCSSRRSASRASWRSRARLFLPSHPGRIVINVADSQGGSVNHVEIFVDGRKQCDTAPCIVDQVAAGPHDVKLLADGFDAPAGANGHRRVAQGRDGRVQPRLLAPVRASRSAERSRA